jgi:hypothetical protein
MCRCEWRRGCCEVRAEGNALTERRSRSLGGIPGDIYINYCVGEKEYLIGMATYGMINARLLSFIGRISESWAFLLWISYCFLAHASEDTRVCVSQK